MCKVPDRKWRKPPSMPAAALFLLLSMVVGLAPSITFANSSCRNGETLIATAEATSSADALARSDSSLQADLARIERGLGREVIQSINGRMQSGKLKSDALTMAVLAAAYSAEGADTGARDLAERAIAEARGSGSEAQVLAIVSTVYLRMGLREEGIALLKRAITLFNMANDGDAAALALLNLSKASRVPEERIQAAGDALLRMIKKASSLRSRQVALDAARIAADNYPAPRWPELEQQLDTLAAAARAGNDRAALAQTHFLRALLHERRASWPDVLAANDAALDIAARYGGTVVRISPDWFWQRARALRAMGKTDDARSAYADLIARLGGLKAALDPLLLGTGSSFREHYGDAYLEYADLLLTHAKSLNESARQPALRQAREVAEFSKVVEISDYFRDPCIGTTVQARTIEAADAAAIVLYPIVYDDRIELLVSSSARIELVTVPVTRADLTKTILSFRTLLEKRTTQQHLRPSRRLYDLLIRPVEHYLPTQAGSTLVIVPDSQLRSIPFSALNDGKRYLIEKMVIGTTVSLSLTNPRRIETQGISASVLGLTEARLGFAGLPAVKDETGRVAQFLRTQPRLDQNFTRKSLMDELITQRPSVLHIASHGQFASDPRESFLLTYDARMDLDSLRTAVALGSASAAGGQSLEMLMLSACQTAAGDERSAMGLAGVALRSGARSALASLWFVNDESTAELSSRFYENLIAKKMARAAALREAQVAMLQDERYLHPAYWAPFLMIGSWL